MCDGRAPWYTSCQCSRQFQSGFAHYIKLVPGKSGQTVVKSAVRGNLGRDAVVVAGRAGKGKVVLSGMNIGCRSTKVEDRYSFEEHVAPGELAGALDKAFSSGQPSVVEVMTEISAVAPLAFLYEDGRDER